MTKEQMEKRLINLFEMLEGGYTAPIKQIEDVIGVETEEERKMLYQLLMVNFEEAGKIELLDTGKIFVI